jgi:putative sterol carrier protein
MSQYWKDGAELEKAVCKMYEVCKATDPAVVKAAAEQGKIIVYKYHDPDAQVWFNGKDFSFGAGEPPAPFDVRISCSGDDGHKAWSNKLNTAMAITRKQLKIEGPVADLLKGAALLKNYAKAYNEGLKQIGKEDIILK